jgi:8-amino-7-oxononanoate synthase
MATLSKAVGVVGAHVAGPASLCALLVNRARSLIFTTALPPAIVEAARVSLQILSGPEGDARRARLHENVRALAKGLGRLGLEADAPAAIVPVLLGSPQRALAASAELRRRGMLVKAIRPPTVPEGTSRLRIAVSAGHTLAQVDELVEGIAAVL